MYNKLYSFIFLIVLGLFFNIHTVKAEQIDNFTTDIVINPDSSLFITETIEYDFGSLQKHGIYRDIIYKYGRNGSNYKIRIDDIRVVDQSEKSYKFKVSHQDIYTKIKIGESDKFVTGKKVFKISYTVRRAINYFDTHDELYWNVTGNEWQVPILASSATVHLPDKFSTDKVRFSCFSGSKGSTRKCTGSNFEINNNGLGNTLVFDQTILASFEGLTVVVGMPAGTLEKLSIFENVWLFLQDNYILFLPFLVFMGMFYMWWTRGRDPEGRGTIITQFDAPDNLSPFEIGTIIDEKAGNRDLSAQLIYWATLGCLDITKVDKKKDYILLKKKDLPDGANEFDKKLFQELFSGGKNEVRLSDLKYKFVETANKIKELVYEDLTKNKYFVGNPNKVRNAYIMVAVIFGMIFVIIAMKLENIPMAISAGGSCFIIFLFGFIMPSKTKKGVLAREHILGLKSYLNVAEKDRINFHNAPTKEPKLFESLLPFAMVLGVEKAWAKQFEGIYNQEPGWYHGDGGSFSALALSRSLRSFKSSTTTNLTSAKSGGSGGSGFGGGGSSGGGFGGGGGGSW